MKLKQKLQKFLGIFCLFTVTVWLTVACNQTYRENLAEKEILSPCREISHILGKDCVSFDINRPLTLGGLDNLLALGIKPVGAALWGGYTEFPTYLKDQTEGIIFLGRESEPNLEKIAYLKPDIILGEKQLHETIYTHLSKIAQTILKPEPNDQDPFFWKKQLTFDAEIFGKSATAQQLLDDYTHRLETFKRQMGEELKTTQVSVVRFFPNSMRLYLKNSFIGGILQDAGLSRPPSQDQEGEFLDISPELISQLDGDVIFVMERDRVADNESVLTRLKNNELWSKLKAVKNGRVYEISESLWVAGAGIIGANLILDDLFQYLIAPFEPNTWCVTADC